MSEDIEEPKKKISWNTNKIMSASALFISVISLIALLYQSYLAREEYKLINKQQSANVLPYLSQSSNNDAYGFSFIFENKGVGPAFINDVQMKYTSEDKEVLEFEDSADFFSEVFNKIKALDTVRYNFSSFTKGYVLPSNKEIAIIEIINPKNSRLFLNSLREKKFAYKIIYSDIYGQQWYISETNNTPQKINLD